MNQVIHHQPEHKKDEADNEETCNRTDLWPTHTVTSRMERSESSLEFSRRVMTSNYRSQRDASTPQRSSSNSQSSIKSTCSSVESTESDLGHLKEKAIEEALTASYLDVRNVESRHGRSESSPPTEQSLNTSMHSKRMILKRDSERGDFGDKKHFYESLVASTEDVLEKINEGWGIKGSFTMEPAMYGAPLSKVPLEQKHHAVLISQSWNKVLAFRSMFAEALISRWRLLASVEYIEEQALREKNPVVPNSRRHFPSFHQQLWQVGFRLMCRLLI